MYFSKFIKLYKYTIFFFQFSQLYKISEFLKSSKFSKFSKFLKFAKSSQNLSFECTDFNEQLTGPPTSLSQADFLLPRQKSCQEFQHGVRQQSCHECLREWACKLSSMQSHFSKPGLALQRVSVQDLPIILPRVSPRLTKNLSKSIAKIPFFCTAGVSNPNRSFDMRLVKVGTLPFESL